MRGERAHRADHRQLPRDPAARARPRLRRSGSPRSSRRCATCSSRDAADLGDRPRPARAELVARSSGRASSRRSRRSSRSPRIESRSAVSKNASTTARGRSGRRRGRSSRGSPPSPRSRRRRSGPGARSYSARKRVDELLAGGRQLGRVERGRGGEGAVASSEPRPGSSWASVTISREAASVGERLVLRMPAVVDADRPRRTTESRRAGRPRSSATIVVAERGRRRTRSRPCRPPARRPTRPPAARLGRVARDHPAEGPRAARLDLGNLVGARDRRDEVVGRARRRDLQHAGRCW